MCRNRHFALEIIAIAAAILMLSGCSSSRSASGRRGSSGKVVTSPVGVVNNYGDLAKDIADPWASALITEAQDWIGTQYVYGGTTRAGTDCSGLVMSVYNIVCGLKIPRSSREQVKYCTKVARNRMVPGDLVFFGAGDDDSVSHVGLYVGRGLMIHASSSRGVIVSDFDSGYWADRYFTGARVDAAPSAYASRHGWKSSAQPASLSEPPVVMAMENPAVKSPKAIATMREPAEAISIDLLDLIINQKVDSIFAEQFAD